MASPQHSRILRIGLLQDGRILEERHLRQPGDFTVGQDPKSSLVLPLPDLPASFPVFEYRANQYNLVYFVGLYSRVFERRFARPHSPLQYVFNQLFELCSSQLHNKMLGTGLVGGDERQINF